MRYENDGFISYSLHFTDADNDMKINKYKSDYGETIRADNEVIPFDYPNYNKRLCEKISVNSTTVIKNDIVERLEKQPLIFLQYTINTVICQGSSTVSLLEWSVAEWKQTDCAGSA